MDEKVAGLIILTISLTISEILPFVSETYKGILHASINGGKDVCSAMCVKEPVLPK